LGIATKLRAERFGDLVPVRARVSFLLQNIMTASGEKTAYCTMYSGALLEVRRVGARI
jgi:hypothetical protein